MLATLNDLWMFNVSLGQWTQIVPDADSLLGSPALFGHTAGLVLSSVGPYLVLYGGSATVSQNASGVVYGFVVCEGSWWCEHVLTRGRAM
jgi:hypothetical protein